MGNVSKGTAITEDIQNSQKGTSTGNLRDCDDADITHTVQTAANDVWTIGTALEWTQGYLGRKGDENPRLSAQWLLAQACDLSRIELYAHFDRPLSMDERNTLRDYVTRRGRGEPLQYITGEVGFRHITLQVRPGVLIPRPETEVLVSEALALLPDAVPFRLKDEDVQDYTSYETVSYQLDLNIPDESERPCVLHEVPPSGKKEQIPADVLFCNEDNLSESDTLFVADLCTGTGCIACSLAYEHSQVHVIATDISPEAIALAQENATSLDLAKRIQFITCDLGEGIPQNFVGTFDLIVSNPPYVPTDMLSEISREVIDYEPAVALDGGADGLDVVRRMLPWCYEALKPGGSLVLELHETSLDSASALVSREGFSDIRIVNDLANRPRVLTACKNACAVKA